jgi:hypothetical protein
MKKQFCICLVLIAAISGTLLLVGWGAKTRTNSDLMQLGVVSNLVLDASGKTVADLTQIAVLCGGSGHTLYLKNCGGFETSDLLSIAAAGSGHVTIEL